MVPPPKLARLLATEPVLAAALAAPRSAVNLQCAIQSYQSKAVRACGAKLTLMPDGN